MIQHMLGARIMTDCEHYLGLPMVGGKSKVYTFWDLHEKITKQVIGWKEKYISKARMKVLIKTTAHAIPTYSMSLFKLPMTLCDTINITLAKNWWGQTKEEKKIHWIKWKRICSPKAKGGMGFCDIHAFNLAMLAKQAWRLIHTTHSLFYRMYVTPQTQKGPKHEKISQRYLLIFPFWQFNLKFIIKVPTSRIIIKILVMILPKYVRALYNNYKDHWPQKNGGLNKYNYISLTCPINGNKVITTIRYKRMSQTYCSVFV